MDIYEDDSSYEEDDNYSEESDDNDINISSHRLGRSNWHLAPDLSDARVNHSLSGSDFDELLPPCPGLKRI